MRHIRLAQLFVPILIGSMLLLALISSLLLTSTVMHASDDSSHENKMAAFDVSSRRLAPTSPYTANLPLVLKLPGSIYGHVSENGTPVSGITVTLHFCELYQFAPDTSIYCQDGHSFDTTTNDNGLYEFVDMPTLVITGVAELSQTYRVAWENEEANPNRLSRWQSRVLNSYIQGDRVNLSNFDIGSVDLISPISGTVTLFPVTFQWPPRASSPSDSYALCLFGGLTPPPPMNPDRVGCEQELGYVDSFTLLTPFLGIDYGYSYHWRVQVFDQDGGFGESYQINTIWFTD